MSENFKKIAEYCETYSRQNARRIICINGEYTKAAIVAINTGDVYIFVNYVSRAKGDGNIFTSTDTIIIQTDAYYYSTIDHGSITCVGIILDCTINTITTNSKFTEMYREFKDRVIAKYIRPALLVKLFSIATDPEANIIVIKFINAFGKMFMIKIQERTQDRTRSAFSSYSVVDSRYPCTTHHVLCDNEDNVLDLLDVALQKKIKSITQTTDCDITDMNTLLHLLIWKASRFVILPVIQLTADNVTHSKIVFAFVSDSDSDSDKVYKLIHYYDTSIQNRAIISIEISSDIKKQFIYQDSNDLQEFLIKHLPEKYLRVHGAATKSACDF